jgi:alpha-galactosidase/6-phospho-beta-glucosidase family protein
MCVNILSRGTVSSLASDIAVEVPVYVDGEGIHLKPVSLTPSKIYRYALLHRLMSTE